MLVEGLLEGGEVREVGRVDPQERADGGAEESSGASSESVAEAVDYTAEFGTYAENAMDFQRCCQDAKRYLIARAIRKLEAKAVASTSRSGRNRVDSCTGPSTSRVRERSSSS